MMINSTRKINQIVLYITFEYVREFSVFSYEEMFKVKTNLFFLYHIKLFYILDQNQPLHFQKE